MLSTGTHRQVRCIATAAWLAVGTVSATAPAVVECVLLWDRRQGRLLGTASGNTAQDEEYLAYGEKLLQITPNDAEYPQVELDLWADCLAGVAELLINDYIILVAESDRIGALLDATMVSGDPIHLHRVQKFVIWPIRKQSAPESPEQEERTRAEEQLKRMLQQALQLRSFYYSPLWDITQRLQQACLQWDRRSFSCTRAADDRDDGPLRGNAYTWNARLMENLLRRMQEAGVSTKRTPALIQPLLLGFVEIFSFQCTDADGSTHPAQYALISRCSRFRAGTRFFRRGVDMNGFVANFVETESVIQSGPYLTSYIQVRGSIPLWWRQPPTLRYKPAIRLVADEKITRQAFDRHFERLSAQYEEPVVIVDLVNQHGSEQMLQWRYALEASRRRIPYVAWDFHHECKGMHYERVHELIAQLEGVLQLQGVFTADIVHRRITQRQRGIIRTNCIDCLDRTNVVQSAIASRMVAVQLRAMGYQDMGDPAEFQRQFRRLWADHADAMAFYYAGSAALKTDFTRTGRRSLHGTLKDGWSAARRYVINNGYDGHRQDAVDVLLGNFAKTGVDLCRHLRRSRQRAQYRLLLWSGLACVATFICALFSSKQRIVIVSFVVLLIIYRLMLRYGAKIVDGPRLVGSELDLTEA
jgi:hypothetical protein